MTNLPRIALTALAALTLASSAQAANADFVGTWKNTNAATRGITRIVVYEGGDGTLTAQVFGKCSPTDCDWGKANMLTYGTSVTDTNHFTASALYAKGFANTILMMNVKSGRMNLQSLTQFIDSSGRQHYASQEQFRR